MSQKYLNVIAPLFLLLVFLVDGQLSSLLTTVTPNPVVVSSYLLFIIALFYHQRIAIWYGVFLYFLLGVLYDIYYFGIIGIAVLLFPLLFLLIYWINQQFRLRRFMSLVLLLIIVFSIEFIGFVIARALNVTNLSLFLFVFYDVMPSLVWNCICLLLLQPLFLKRH